MGHNQRVLAGSYSRPVRTWRLFLFFLYTAIFRHTPEDYRPYALFFPRIRNALLTGSLMHCGRNIRVKSGADISPNISIGDDSELGTRCLIQSGSVIGSNVIMGPDVKIYTRNHRYDTLSIPIRQQGDLAYRTVIGNDVWIGANVIILPGRKIGNHAVLAAGAVISHDVPDCAVVAGNPATIVKYRSP